MKRTHANTAIGAFGGAPFGTAKRARGVPMFGGAGACEHRPPLGRRSVNLPAGHETFEGCGEMYAVGSCARSHWGLR
eukprot:8771487-Pyramimonas_sp.AAC.1